MCIRRMKLEKNVLVCFGTRPEYIKVKSIIENVGDNGTGINMYTLFTGQHKDLLSGIQTDCCIEIGNNRDNRLNNIVGDIIKSDVLNNFINLKKITHVIVQGDTSSAFSVALAVFNIDKNIKIIHLEAGLRTYNKIDPYPEEMNRRLISQLATIHLCPTEHNKKNLENENINENIYIVGNTGLDGIDRENIVNSSECKEILITMHRRENLDNMERWFMELSKIAEKYGEYRFTIPLHPNPKIQGMKKYLEGINIINPMSHGDIIKFIKKCRLVISDSGGLQEEASFLNKKIIVCRKTTERPESNGIESNHSVLCTGPNKLAGLFENIVKNPIINEECPYGDGYSWKKIKEIIEIME